MGAAANFRQVPYAENDAPVFTSHELLGYLIDLPKNL